MTDELGPGARALLDAAREGLSPDPAAVRRVRARIGMAGGAAAGTALGSTLGVKLAALALAVAVAVGAGWIARRSGAAVVATPKLELASPPEPVVRTAMPEAPAPALVDDDLITIETSATTGTGAVPSLAALPSRGEPRRGPPGPSAITAPRSEAERAPGHASASPSTPAPVMPPAPVMTTAAVTPAPTTSTGASPGGALPGHGAPGGRSPAGASPAGASPAGASPARGSPARGSIDLAREVELVDLAMAALRRGDASAALRAVQRHASETGGRGQLAEDAAAIEIEALCHLHDPSTSAKLEMFDARFPRSAQRSRLDNQCP